MSVHTVGFGKVKTSYCKKWFDYACFNLNYSPSYDLHMCDIHPPPPSFDFTCYKSLKNAEKNAKKDPSTACRSIDCVD